MRIDDDEKKMKNKNTSKKKQEKKGLVSTGPGRVNKKVVRSEKPPMLFSHTCHARRFL